jgi:hypothetical protein
VLTEEKLDEINAGLYHSSQNLLRHFAQQFVLSKTSAQVATKFLTLETYTAT